MISDKYKNIKDKESDEFMTQRKKLGRKLLSFLLTLALVLGLMPGMGLTAYAAPTETLLTTITATGKEQANYSTANVATVSFSYTAEGSSAYLANWGWWGYGWIATVTPADGYTITKCVFYDDANRTATDSEAPFVVETTEEDKTPKVNGTPILAYTSKGIKKIEVYGYATPAATHSVTITAGDHMTKTAGSGDAEQTGLTGAMTDVVYIADNGYYFPTDYSVAEVSGIKVTRDSYTQITVSGTPTADATITLTAPTAKTTPAGPTTAAAVDCATSDNNDGKLTGVTTAMEYKKSDATEWTTGTGSDITGLVPGTYYVRVKATETTNASTNQELTIKGFISYTVTFKVVNGKWNEGEGDAATADKTVTLTGHDGDTLKLTADQIPAVGTKPNDTYKAGSWDTTPSADTGITADTTYTYTYAQKDSISQTVTFKVVNGSWDDETTADKTVTLTGYEGDTLKLAANQIPAVGTKPNTNYKAGSWDVTPSAETEITGATTYTYTYAQKDSISQTVTFKVVNGSWNDETTTDKTVTLTGYEGDTLKLAANQIPAVGTKPNDTYKAGSWDVTPSADTAITAATTYTYTYAQKDSISQTVTFKVVNGKWDDDSTEDKTVTLTGYEGDTLKLAANQIPAVGTKPSDTYKAGSWDVTPSADTAITAATTYTYTYAQKDSISQTVTFKVVNGSWNDETTTDKTVTLTGYEGDTLKLAANQIPAVGNKPNDTYKAGSWDVTPSTETAITEATTYTYTYAAKEASVVTKAPEAKTLTYNGSAQELVTAGTATGGTMQYALGTATEATQPYTTSIPTATNAGTYYVWYKAVGDDNHIDSKEFNAKVDISAVDKADLQAAIENTQKYYESIKDNDDYKEIAGTLKTALDTANVIAANDNVTSSEVEDAVTNISGAKSTAENAVKSVDDKKTAKAVTDKISALPSSDKVATTDKEAIEEARKAYDALTEDQKKLVDADTLKKLTDAEAALTAAENKKDEAPGNNYSSEWVDGLWYNADGTQTYGYKGSWKTNGFGWWYEAESGWYPVATWQKIDGKWYYFDAAGYMASNEWIGGYWLSGNGAWEYEYIGGWKTNGTDWWYEDTSGWYPVSQWQKIDGKWYYFGSDGIMLTDQYIDDYWVGSDGSWQ